MFLSLVISFGIPNESERSSSSLSSLISTNILSLGIRISCSDGIVTPSSLAINAIRQCGGNLIFDSGRPTEGELSLSLISRILRLPTEK